MQVRSMLFGASAAVLVALPFTFHTHLTKADPEINGVIKESPRTVRLWFSERPEVAVTGATLMKEDHSPVAVVKLAATDDTLSVAGPVPISLDPGKYMVMWKTASSDGHVARGMYFFTVDPAGGASGNSGQ